MNTHKCLCCSTSTDFWHYIFIIIKGANHESLKQTVALFIIGLLTLLTLLTLDRFYNVNSGPAQVSAPSISGKD